MRVSTEDRRTQLIDAAVRVLKREGVQKASLRNIAAEAGASLAAVHVCFTNKEELLRAAVDLLIQQSWLNLDDADESTVGLDAACRKVFDGYWSTMTADPAWALTQFEVGIWAIRERQHHRVLSGIYDLYETRVSAIIETACAKAGESLAIPAREVARGLLVIIDGCNLQYFSDPLSPDARRLAYLMLDGLVARSLASPRSRTRSA